MTSEDFKHVIIGDIASVAQRQSLASQAAVTGFIFGGRTSASLASRGISVATDL